MSLLKIEAFSGLSGDMFLGALADLAGAHEEMRGLPALLGLQDEVEVTIQEVNKCGIACRQVRVRETGPDPHHHHGDHHHDHADEHGAPHGGHHHHGPHHHHHGHEPGHPHEHPRHHAHPPPPPSPPPPACHHHEHRNLPEILALIDRSGLTDRAKVIAKEIFLQLGQAESQVHGIDINHVHFHEVGAWDSITDIAGAALLLDRLNVEQTFCTPVTTGFGFTNTSHGRLPVPCPATKALLQGMPTLPGEIAKEMTTPTGAAILRFLHPVFEMPVLVDEVVGHGPGERDLPIPNVLRVALCHRAEERSTLVQVQTNIDDMKGEYLGQAFQDGLLHAGALDFHLEQVIMKKGRPGIVLNALCAEKDRAKVCEYILEQTSSIGLRYFPVQRIESPRSTGSVEALGKTIPVKSSVKPSGRSRWKAESDAIQKAARELGMSPLEVEEQIVRASPPPPQPNG